jgi:chemotaxis protein MotB
MARRKEEAHGGHGWFVTFADLMGLLVSFFVMLVAFSNQDSKKVQIVTGSMREAFGVQKEARFSGITEYNGSAQRPKLLNAAHIRPEESSITPTPDEHSSSITTDQKFALAVASLRQALGEFPELAEASKHIMIEETHDGLNIELVDQDGSSMFAAESTEPYDRTRVIVQKLAGPLRATTLRISITGHTAASESSRPGYGKWELSLGRANAVRRILEEEGYPSANFYTTAGKADTDPLISENPTAAPNRRVTITLIHEAPPLPANLQP